MNWLFLGYSIQHAPKDLRLRLISARLSYHFCDDLFFLSFLFIFSFSVPLHFCATGLANRTARRQPVTEA